ncbi:hypothetical protein [Virgibacillus sp. DJP39]|uniref:hypothetical protein n=1 Tax=Virgibacillus sp. DJP39 TaxID=3409790 RepID=UPI003BB619ED
MKEAKNDEGGFFSNITGGMSDVVNTLKGIPNEIENVFQTFSNVIDWFEDLPIHITNFITGLTEKVYELIASLILKTPLWIFDNNFFEETTLLFSAFSVSLVSILTIIESIKRIYKKKHVDLKTISQRWFLVAGLSTVVPFLFHKAFQILNFLSEKIININAHYISNPITTTLPIFDLFVLLVFNVVLISMSIPILLKNGKRFFDLLILGIISPLALSTWVFESHKHYFKQWWENVKRLSLVQIVYAFYLLVIGLIIYGIPIPSDDFIGSCIKILVVLGGFNSLINPPTFLQKHLNFNGDSIGSIFKEGNKSRKTVLRNFKNTVDTLKNPINVIKKLSNSPQTSNSISNTRMGRRHKK